MSNQPSIILVHGAWGEGSHWRKVIPQIIKAGYHVVASQNPLTSLADDAEIVRRLAESLEGKIILVGHSYAGAVITEAATKIQNVAGLVYIAAFVPDKTESVGSLLNRTEPPAGLANIYPDDYGFLWVKKDKFRESLAHDCSIEDCEIMAATQKPTSAKCFEDKPTRASWKSFPTWYQISEQDQMIPPTTQSFLAERMGATTLSLNSSHMPMISHPDEISNFIISAAKKLE